MLLLDMPQTPPALAAPGPDAEAFVPASPTIGPDRILRIQGYSDVERVRPAIRRAAVAMAELAEALSVPRVVYRRVPVTSMAADLLELAGGVRFRCGAFPRILAGCTEAIAFVLTIGPGLEARGADLSGTDRLLEALLLDTAGWLAIEDATRQFQRHLRGAARERGGRITSRMGPGYSYEVDGETCTWPLDEQAALLGLIGNAMLPVSITAERSMRPRMSRSGLIGSAPLPLVAKSAPGADAA
jgi:hypothetical protein